MRTCIARQILITAGSGLTLLPLLCGPVLAGPGDRQLIEKQLQRYEARFNHGEADALAELFSADVVYYGPLGQVFEGRDAVVQRYRASLEAGFSDMTVELIEIQVHGDTAYDIARYTISGPQGEPFAGYHLAILEKVDGEWIVRRTLVNAEMPEPPKN